jgi:TonB family protein
VRGVTLLAIALSAALSAQDSFTPARFDAGGVPALPALAVGGGEVLLEVSIGRDGRVTEAKPLRMTAPYSDVLIQAVRGWHFRPAEDATAPAAPAPVESKVLVAAVFRPPALNMPTLGEVPREGAPASAETAFPLKMAVPAFPPQASRGGVVLLEARIDRDGSAGDVRVLRSAPPFDEPARRALGDWIFRPARIQGADAPSYVYVVLGFATPVGLGSAPAGTLQ